MECIQFERPLNLESNPRCRYFEVTVNSNFERSIRDDEIEPLEPTGTASTSVSIFDDNYVPVKLEPEEDRYTAEESTRIIIGQLLSQPDSVAKNINQELLDSTAQQVLE